MPWNLPSGKNNYTLTMPFRRKKRTYVINQPDPSYSVVYLGNVLTMLAKGDGCVEKPLSLIWKAYRSRTRPDLNMKLMVTRSGLKAETKQQGLTEYWSHRITYCVSPEGYPKVFCWVYKHEGKRMKPELRCHAVLCRRLSDPPEISVRLQDYLQSALAEYKREKLSNQRKRLSLEERGSVPSGSTALSSGLVTMPRRRQLLDRAAKNNYRPPLSRSKSAPKLDNIDEDLEEIDEHEQEDERVPVSSVNSDASTSGCSGGTGGSDDVSSSGAGSESPASLVCMEPRARLRPDDEEEEDGDDERDSYSTSSTPTQRHSFSAEKQEQQFSPMTTIISIGGGGDSPSTSHYHRYIRHAGARSMPTRSISCDDPALLLERLHLASSSHDHVGGRHADDRDSATMSDESGYHERSEKSSLENEDGTGVTVDKVIVVREEKEEEDDDSGCQITAF